MITCQALAKLVAELHPALTACEVAQMCLLVLRTVDDPTSSAAASLSDPVAVDALVRAASFRLDAASDQHAAMTAELEAIFGEGPMRFSPDQIWTLLRAVKVQSQMLELYAGAPALA